MKRFRHEEDPTSKRRTKYRFIIPTRSAWWYYKKETKVYCLNEDRLLNSIEEACYYFNCPFFQIHRAVKEQLYIHGKYQVKYIEFFYS